MITVKSRISVTHHIKSFYKDGTLFKEYPPMKNMITAGGMDMLAANYLGAVTTYMHVGTGTTATSRAITASQSGTTVEATAGTFVQADADNARLIIFAEGLQATIATYTDLTHVEVNESQPADPQSAAIYNIEQTALTTELENTNVCNATNNGGTLSKVDTTMYLNYKRTGVTQGSYPSGATITEIGLSPDGGALFSRLLLATPVEIAPGGFIENTHILSVIIDGATQTLTGPITGVVEDATARTGVSLLALTALGDAVSSINSNGTMNTPSQTIHAWTCEPCHASDIVSATYLPYISVSDDTAAIATASTAGGASNEFEVQASTTAYAAGSHTRSITTTITGSQYTSAAWRTISIETQSKAFYDYRMIWDSNRTVTAGNQLNLTFTKSWSRG